MTCVQGPPEALVFDAANPNVFLAAGARQWHTYVYSPNASKGAVVKHVSSMNVERGPKPLALTHQGVTAQVPNGGVTTLAVDGLRHLATDELQALPASECSEHVRCVHVEVCPSVGTLQDSALEISIVGGINERDLNQPI